MGDGRGPMLREDEKQHDPNDRDGRQNNGDREQMSVLAQRVGGGHQHGGADDIQNENAMVKHDDERPCGEEEENTNQQREGVAKDAWSDSCVRW